MALPPEDSLQEPDEKSEHEHEAEDAQDQREANPKRTAHPEPGPRGHHAPAAQLERQEHDEDHDGQKPERPDVERD